MVQFQELDLVVGDVISVGGVTLTIIDIDNDEVSIRVDDGQSNEDIHIDDLLTPASSTLPR